MSDQTPSEKYEPTKRIRVTLVLAGIILGQMILYGPSLVGQKILLPLDILAGKNVYLPQTPENSSILPKDPSVSDLVLQSEPARRFAVSELRAGELPQWAPYQYCGAPFIALPLLSPFSALLCSTASPIILAWTQLMLAIVAGTGAYRFFRSALDLSFWPAAFGAWLFPLTGFFIFWQGFSMSQALAWLPWLFLVVDRTIRGGSRWAPLGLAAATFLVINTQLDVAAQVLLSSGLYSLWCLSEFCRDQTSVRDTTSTMPDTGQKLRPRFPVQARWVIGKLLAGWALGLVLAAPYVLPFLAYTKTGSRMAQRAGGSEERPPLGLTALPQLVVPDIYGTHQPPSLRIAGEPAQQESSAAGYVGLLATLLAAPLAFCSRRHFRANLLWLALAFLAISWSLNVPGLINFLRLPGLRMMSHNRLVFLDCFVLLSLAVTGLDVLWKQSVQWRSWMWLPLSLLLALCAWCAISSAHPPQIVSKLAALVAAGDPVDWLRDSRDIQRVQAWFSQYYASVALVSGLGALGWLLLRARRVPQRHFGIILAMMLTAELCWFAYGRNVQSSPKLYYPPIPVLHQLGQTGSARVMGFGCLPAILSAVCGVRDVRGYDAVDPARMVALILGAGDSASGKPRYAVTMVLAPKATTTPAGDIQLSPVLDMLGVGYIIFRGSPFPSAHPVLQDFDYWVLRNPRALPRAYVPEKVQVISDDSTRLAKIEAADFDPRAVAFTETSVELPEHCAGSVDFVQDSPKHLVLSAKMQTKGMVVLADSWDQGWHASLDDKPVAMFRVNHAIRGVVVTPGTHRIDFHYTPAGFGLGLALAIIGLITLLGWAGINARHPGRTS